MLRAAAEGLGQFGRFFWGSTGGIYCRASLLRFYADT
jgi:hypothetical protein